MNVTIRKGVLGMNVPDAVPPPYREAAARAVSPAGTYALLLFAHAARDVVPSAAVRRALRRAGPLSPGAAVAVGAVFTEEALGLLAEGGVVPVALHARRWTDEEARGRQP